GGHVPDDDVDGLAPLLAAQPPQHGERGVDGPGGDARGGQRQRQPAAASAELEHAMGAAAGCERRYPFHRCRGIGHVAVPVVVNVGEAVAVRAGSVTVHGCLPTGMMAYREVRRWGWG